MDTLLLLSLPTEDASVSAVGLVHQESLDTSNLQRHIYQTAFHSSHSPQVDIRLMWLLTEQSSCPDTSCLRVMLLLSLFPETS